MSESHLSGWAQDFRCGHGEADWRAFCPESSCCLLAGAMSGHFEVRGSGFLRSEGLENGAELFVALVGHDLTFCS